jgi:hypothetical protein
MPTMFRRLSAVLAAGVLTTALLSTAPAYANCYHNPTKELLNSRLSAAVYCTDGEWLGVHDDQADGYSARAAIQLYQSQVGFWYDAHECFRRNPGPHPPLVPEERRRVLLRRHRLLHNLIEPACRDQLLA